ncbi:site-specific integrase [Priestia koreensis]|uniref:site-specific integrase n=1 Tax=Priestia koreensis TaxID=284581 RepID=UPI002041F6F1|nr:site-specific integrase [Priestia koreensis]MCM3003649.1 site-specific integrase [Priestia koreensis]
MGISFRQHTKTKDKNKGKTKEWEYRIRIKDPINHKYIETSKRGFNSKDEARFAAQKREKELLEGINQIPISLESHLSFWLNEYMKGEIRNNTFELHERNIKNHILPYFKNIILQDINSKLYQKFLNDLADKTYLTLSGEKYYSFRTNQIIHSTMRSALDYAVEIGEIEKNPCSKAKVKSSIKDEDENLCYMETENIANFLNTAYSDNYIYYIFFKTLLLTGMRKGEAAALQWNDIDFERKTININKSLNFQPKIKGQIFGDTKNFTSKREIDIDDMLLIDLKKHKIWTNKQKIKLGKAYHHSFDLVFTKDDGNFLPKSTLFNAFNRILNKANIPQIPIHGLRHTHAVTALEAEIDLKVIQERLGHKSLQITSDIYSHISKKLNKRKTKQYENYMKTILN